MGHQHQEEGVQNGSKQAENYFRAHTSFPFGG
jgi:hypothetical protein